MRLFENMKNDTDRNPQFDDRLVKRIILALAAAYPTFKLAADTLEIYVQRLNYYPPELLKEATVACIDEYKFFPTVAEIKDKAICLYSQHRGYGMNWARTYLEDRQQGKFIDDGYSRNLLESGHGA
jgi:hypothetical protein